MLMNNKFHQTKLKNNATKLNLVQALQTNCSRIRSIQLTLPLQLCDSVAPLVLILCTGLRTANFVR